MNALAATVTFWLLRAISHAAGAPAGSSEPSPPDARDPVLMEQVSDLVWRGQTKFELSEYNAALEFWMAGYELLPDVPAYEPNRQFLRRVIANTHKTAYGIDGDLQHLYKARALLSEHLDALDDDDTQARAEIHSELESMLAMIEDAERELQARELALAEAEASARMQAIEQAQREQVQANARVEARQRATRNAHNRRVFERTGGALIGLGVTSGGLFVASLLLGEQIDRRGQRIVDADDYTQDDHLGDLKKLRDQGFVYNGLALGTGIASGVLLVAGTSLLLTARLKWHDNLDVRIEPGLGRFAIKF